jgi:hypothetical protein
MIVIKPDQKTGKILLVFGANIGNQLFRTDAQLLGLEHDGSAMRVIGTHIKTLALACFLESHPDIGLDGFQQMAEVQGAVGVGQGAGDEDSAGWVHDDGVCPVDFNLPWTIAV